MASYYLPGYTTPTGVDSREEVREYQRMLGVTADGIWGPVTQAAYANAYGVADPFPAYGDAFQKYYETVMDTIGVPGVSVNIPSRDEIKKEYEDALRPGVDYAIGRRRKRGEEVLAEIDVDAASRGMAASTYVTSVKEREGDDVEEDVSIMEAQYTATLAERIASALEYYASLELQAATANAQMQANASNTALGIAWQWYQSYLAGLAPGTQSGSGDGRGAQAEAYSSGLTEEYIDYMFALTPDQRAGLFYSTLDYWKLKRENIIAALGQRRFEALRKDFEATTDAVGQVGATGGSVWQMELR
ncbi:MAG TPA: hypothetical protein VN540_04775 [Clostridia bacterium]|nr:hypothetical protein [Clostridia bacterium]